MKSNPFAFRPLLLVLGGLCAVYCLAVLYTVATVPDPGLRCLLLDPLAMAQAQRGELYEKIALTQVGWGETANGLQIGDVLRSVDGIPVGSASEVAAALHQASGGVAGGNSLRLEVETASGTARVDVAVEPAPWHESFLTLIWFFLELVLLGLGGIALWRRPFDRPARIFFAMSVVTMGGFVGGFHWWLLSGSLWLTLPYGICALLVPVVTLHFFLVYPRPKPPLAYWPRTTLMAIYAIPVATVLWFLGIELLLWQTLRGPAALGQRLLAVHWHGVIRTSVYLYLTVAAAYFAATLAALVHSVATTRNPLERKQVTWILWAGLIATGFIGYTLVLAYWDRETFARGGGRLPMFLAGFVFMVAYAVGMVRFKLILSDAWSGRRLGYQLLRIGGTLVLSLIVAAVGLAVGQSAAVLPTWSGVLLGTGVMIFVAALAYGRDLWQTALDRLFFRERHRFDRALQRIHHTVGQLADPAYLSERTLLLCRDALESEWAALYLCEPRTAQYRLTAVEGIVATLPLDWTPPSALLLRLRHDGSLFSGTRGAEAVAEALSSTGADGVHALDVDGEPAGLLLLGPKRAGGLYTAEDATFLAALTQITGVALHCARVHQDLSQLNEQLRLKVERITQQKQQILMLQGELAARQPSPVAGEEEFRRDAIKGTSPSLVRVLETARKVAASDTTSVLLRGESGTGKELLARAIHDNSPRRAEPMISVHCAALAASLLESELFGHVKGAFTGATSDKRGRFELANGGTLFLDEIGEIAPETQVKLLRVLQEREIEPVGGSTPVRVDVRLVAATHRPLEQMIRDGLFREDLYYRLNVLSLTLPPLRERKEDLHELAASFLHQAASRIGKRISEFEDAALDALLRYEWPGNVRELENVIERAVVLAERGVISLTDLPTDIQAGLRGGQLTQRGHRDETLSAARGGFPADGDWRTLSTQEERRVLVGALQQTQGNKARAARLLGLPRSTFFSKLKKHALAD